MAWHVSLLRSNRPCIGFSAQCCMKYRFFLRDCVQTRPVCRPVHSSTALNAIGLQIEFKESGTLVA